MRMKAMTEDERLPLVRNKEVGLISQVLDKFIGKRNYERLAGVDYAEFASKISATHILTASHNTVQTSLTGSLFSSTAYISPKHQWLFTQSLVQSPIKHTF